ncbi:hypothetical protein Dimus_038455 [Dionaea muscipula]
MILLSTQMITDVEDTHTRAHTTDPQLLIIQGSIERKRNRSCPSRQILCFYSSWMKLALKGTIKKSVILFLALENHWIIKLKFKKKDQQGTNM